MKKLGIIGPNKSMCSADLYDFGVKLGANIATKESAIICGGMGGFMEAVCKGAKQSPETYQGQTIGILPGEEAETANPYIDTPIPTGTGIGRNLIIVRTADIIIAAGGGAGTLSEIALAWQLGKTVLCITLFDGWAKELAGRNLDKRKEGLLRPVTTIEEINQALKA